MIMNPLEEEDWIPVTVESDPPCPTIAIRCKIALPTDEKVVSYNRRIAQDDDEHYHNGVYSVFNNEGVRYSWQGESFPYEMYRYKNGKYDYVLIDCMPSLGMITVNALAAADSVIIPVQAHYLPAKGMSQLLQTIGRVKKNLRCVQKMNLTPRGRSALLPVWHRRCLG